MPLIDLTCGAGFPDALKRDLAGALPTIVSEAVACAEEPFDGDLRPGDVLIRVRDCGPLDRFDLDVVVEIHSKWSADRAADRQRRADDVRDAVQALIGRRTVGVYLRLPSAAWAQTD